MALPGALPRHRQWPSARRWSGRWGRQPGTGRGTLVCRGDRVWHISSFRILGLIPTGNNLDHMTGVCASATKVVKGLI